MKLLYEKHNIFVQNEAMRGVQYSDIPKVSLP